MSLARSMVVTTNPGWVMMMARTPRAVRWRPAGAAAAFALAAVAGVVGNQLTGHLSWALGVFVVLLTTGMAVTFLLERHSDGQAADDDQGDDAGEPRAGTSGPWGAQGLQVGDGNRQFNYFGPGPTPGRRR
jgi:hypothetical protein